MASQTLDWAESALIIHSPTVTADGDLTPQQLGGVVLILDGKKLVVVGSVESILPVRCVGISLPMSVRIGGRAVHKSE
jgi:hypothetical protein